MKQVFHLHIDHMMNPRGNVWALSFAGRYEILSHVDVQVPIQTVFRGRNARQPKAYLLGVGEIKIKGRKATITNGNHHSRKER